jgi:hypothetical protein
VTGLTAEGNITINQGRTSGDEQLLQKMAETIHKQAELIAQLASSSLGADEDTRDSTQPTPKDPPQVNWDDWDKVVINDDGTIKSRKHVDGDTSVFFPDARIEKGEFGSDSEDVVWERIPLPSPDPVRMPFELNVELLHHIYCGNLEVLAFLWLSVEGIISDSDNNSSHPAFVNRGKKYTEILRRDLIWKAILGDMDLSRDMLFRLPNESLSNLCGIFGIKRSGSLIQKRQRLWLHLYMDPYALNPDTIQDMSRDELHELCRQLGVIRSGSKTQLLECVENVIVREEGNWGKIKKSLRK